MAKEFGGKLNNEELMMPCDFWLNGLVGTLTPESKNTVIVLRYVMHTHIRTDS